MASSEPPPEYPHNEAPPPPSPPPPAAVASVEYSKDGCGCRFVYLTHDLAEKVSDDVQKLRQYLEEKQNTVVAAHNVLQHLKKVAEKITKQVELLQPMVNMTLSGFDRVPVDIAAASDLSEESERRMRASREDGSNGIGREQLLQGLASMLANIAERRGHNRANNRRGRTDDSD